MSPVSVAHSPIPYHVRREVERECERLGYWWPPDLLDAIVEGRKKYHAIDPEWTWPVHATQLDIIRPALDRHWYGWRDAAPPARTRR